jgi:hypothetical protein
VAITPLVAADVDLRDFPAMMIDIARLFGSEFHAASNDAEWRAGVTLWLRSFHQVPAGSLPSDEASLTRLAELGKDVKSWRKIRTKTLRGWALASDGRYYHKTVAEKVLEAWLEKLGQRKSSGTGNAKRYGGSFDPAPVEAQIEQAVRMLSAINPQSRALRKRPLKGLPTTSEPPPDGSPDGSADHAPSGSQGKGKEGKGLEASSLCSEASPQTPSGGFCEGTMFLDFEAVYPFDTIDRRSGARIAFEALPEDDRRAAIVGAKSYAEVVRREGRKVKFAKGWLEERGWETFASVRDAAAAERMAAQVFVVKNSRQWQAWARELGKDDLLSPFPTMQRGRVEGWLFDSEWPPGYEPTVESDAPRENAA